MALLAGSRCFQVCFQIRILIERYSSHAKINAHMSISCTNAKISLIVPVYNAEPTLKRCLNSILLQGDENLEILIVNDGSTDGSQHVIDQFVSMYPGQIRTIQTPNQGQGKTQNLGLEAATGSYVGFVDSDDYLAPDYFKVVRGLLSGKPDMLVISYHRHYQKKPGFFERRYPFTKPYPTECTSLQQRPEILCHTEGAAWMRLVKTEVVQNNTQLRFSSSPIALDVEFSSKLFLHLDSVIYTTKPLYNYVITNSSANFGTINKQSFVAVIDSICKYYHHHNQFHRYFHELEILVIKHLVVSNIRRLRSAKYENKFQLFMELRDELLNRFPDFQRNKYLQEEPYFVRAAVAMTKQYPSALRAIF